MTFALLALATLVFNDTVEVPRSKLALVPIEVNGEAARIQVEFRLMNAGSGVRAALLTSHDADLLEDGKPHRVLASTPYRQTGAVRAWAEPGRYAVLLDNRMEGRYGAEVWLRVQLEPEPRGRQVRYASPLKRAWIIGLSLLFFVAVAGYALRRLWPALR